MATEGQTDLIVPEPPEAAEVPALVAQARALVITDAASYEAGLAWLRDVLVPRRKAVEEFFKPLKAAAQAAHKRLCARENEILAGIPEDLVREKCGVWFREAERRRAEEQAIARAKAEAEAKAAQLAVAEAAMDADDLEQAERVLATPPAPVVAAAPLTPKPTIKGVSGRENYSAQVVDLRAFVTWCLQSDDRLAYLTVNQSAINALAKRLKSAFRVPGLALASAARMVVRGR